MQAISCSVRSCRTASSEVGYLLDPVFPYMAWFHATRDDLGNIRTVPCTLHEQCGLCAPDARSPRRLRGFLPLKDRNRITVFLLDMPEFSCWSWLEQRMQGFHNPGDEVTYRRETKMPRSRLLIEPGDTRNRIKRVPRPWVLGVLDRAFPGAQWLPLAKIAQGAILGGDIARLHNEPATAEGLGA